jgi:hypothetical protein
MLSVAYFVVEGGLKWGTSLIIGGLNGIIRRLGNIGKSAIAESRFYVCLKMKI